MMNNVFLKSVPYSKIIIHYSIKKPTVKLPSVSWFFFEFADLAQIFVFQLIIARDQSATLLQIAALDFTEILALANFSQIAALLQPFIETTQKTFKAFFFLSF